MLKITGYAHTNPCKKVLFESAGKTISAGNLEFDSGCRYLDSNHRNEQTFYALCTSDRYWLLSKFVHITVYSLIYSRRYSRFPVEIASLSLPTVVLPWFVWAISVTLTAFFPTLDIRLQNPSLLDCIPVWIISIQNRNNSSDRVKANLDFGVEFP